MERNLDMTLTLNNDGTAQMTYIDHESGEDFKYKFHFTGELDGDRNAQAFTIGQEILSWFDVMKVLLEEKEG